MMSQPKCGLLAAGKAVPLTGVRVDAQLLGACVDVTVTQRYHNREAQPVEAVFVFPLDEGAAVCGFAARIGERLVQGKVLERDDAFAAYDDALHAGDGAFLLDQERPNVFTASVGNLRPDEVVELRIRYVAAVAREGSALRLAIPSTVSPRYVPHEPVQLGQPDAERVNPERWPEVPYGLALRVDVREQKLRSVESPSHPIRTALTDEGASVQLSQEDVALDRDFVLMVESAAAHEPVARVARDEDGRRVLMLTFLPQDLGVADGGHELLFLLDCSGSMEGTSIAQAKRALALCVRALGTNDTFNVICFGSTHSSLWKKPRRLDEASLLEATRHVQGIEANLGGTEIMAPLRALLEQKRDAGRPRRVLVLTDGQVSNEAEVIAIAKQHASDTRIFAFGIGEGASEHLVRGMARASRGAAEMIFSGERIEPKVLRTFARVRTPALDDVRIDYRGLSVVQAPSRVPPVFAGDVLTVFARVESGSATDVELFSGAKSWRVTLDLERAESGGSIPTLWARECIRELDDGTALSEGSRQQRPEAQDRKRARLIELGTRYGLVSSATSFVAIEERSAHERTTTPAELRRIPVAITHGWGGGAQRPQRPSAMPPLLFAGSMNVAPMIRRAAPTAPMVPMASAAPMKKQTSVGLLERARRVFLSGSNEGAEFVDVSAKELSSAPTDRVFDLLMTQRADGSFPRSALLEAWLGQAHGKKLEQLCAQHGEALVITSVVIALLVRDEPGRASEWRPAVDKARAWCSKQAAVFDAQELLSEPSASE